MTSAAPASTAASQARLQPRRSSSSMRGAARGRASSNQRVKRVRRANLAHTRAGPPSPPHLRALASCTTASVSPPAERASRATRAAARARLPLILARRGGGGALLLARPAGAWPHLLPPPDARVRMSYRRRAPQGAVSEGMIPSIDEFERERSMASFALMKLADFAA